LKNLCIALFLMLVAPSTFAVTEQPITLETLTGKIEGTLALPAAEKSSAKIPVVLIIAGSGPTDRNGNSRGLSGNNDSLKMLASILSEAGIASVRYDKRGIASSAAVGVAERDLRFETYVKDASAWVEKLASDERFSAISILGHSEGSLIGMLAAKSASVKSFVSVAGPAQVASAILRQQLSGKLPPELATRNEEILVSLEQGKTVTDVPPALGSLYRANVQPYLISWFKYTPAKEFSQLSIPTLILQGDTDIQVSVAEAKALKDANKAAELAIISGMNHVLKQVPADQAKQIASYSDPTLPLSPELAKMLIVFLKRVN
jgi:uncharacterized protein